MKRLRTRLLPLVLALALPTAHAASLGTLTYSLTHTAALTYPKGAFSDLVSFSIANDNTYVLLGVTGLLTDGTWGLYSAANFASLLDGTWGFGTGGRNLQLDAGNYFVGFQGVSLTDQGIVVAGGVTGVPEPETYAMLLAGLGVLGLVVRRSPRRGV